VERGTGFEPATTCLEGNEKDNAKVKSRCENSIIGNTRCRKWTVTFKIVWRYPAQDLTEKPPLCQSENPVTLAVRSAPFGPLPPLVL